MLKVVLVVLLLLGTDGVVICHGSHGYILVKKFVSLGKIFGGTYALVLEYFTLFEDVKTNHFWEGSVLKLKAL